MIEYAKLEDKEEIYNLICILENKEINKEHFDYVFENSLKDEDIIYLVYRDEKIEGFLSFKIHHYLHHDHDTSEIVELVVLPEKRNLKIGKQLIEKLKRLLKKNNLNKLNFLLLLIVKMRIAFMKDKAMENYIIIIRKH